ncbi:MAG: MetS family NSS transporter small subunit [Firmicutes bacterium]|nr:MetS family NSS transporter small subunit [Bacillota bacterium]
MSSSAIIMMVVGCGLVWGGAITAIIIALKVEKKNAAKA